MELIEVILSKENLNRAYKKVVANKGASGVDGVAVEELGDYIRENKEAIVTAIRNRTYKPKPVRRVYIPKDNGKQRPLGIPTVLDRTIQQAIAQPKKNIRMDAENKPEYAGGSDDLLEQKYLDEYVPVQDDTSGIWCVQTEHGFESGDINYIASEFSGTGLIYHFMHNGERDHVHGFESVLVQILKDPEYVDIVTDYGEYSDQEI